MAIAVQNYEAILVTAARNNVMRINQYFIATSSRMTERKIIFTNMSKVIN